MNAVDKLDQRRQNKCSVHTKRNGITNGCLALPLDCCVLIEAMDLFPKFVDFFKRIVAEHFFCKKDKRTRI